MTEELTLQALTVQGHTVLAVSGEIDISTATVLRKAIDTMIQDGTHRLIVDLENVGFMDSSGLNTLISVIRRLGPGSLLVVASQHHIRRVFSLSGIDQLIPLFGSVAAAIEAT